VRLMRRPRDAAGLLDEQWQPRLYIRWIALIAVTAYLIAFILENGKHV